MKSPLRFLLAICAFLLIGNASAQFVEPTINGTLDSYKNLQPGDANSKNWTVITTAGGRANEMVKIRMRLKTPADQSKFILERFIKTDQKGTGEIVKFDANGVAILGGEDFFPLKDDVNAAVLGITFLEEGLYVFDLELLRNDGNVLARSNEIIKVGNVAGLDDVIEGSRIAVYPVPSESNKEVTLDLGGLANASVMVIDLLGKPVYQADKVSGTTRISTAGLAKGVYLVKVVKGSEAAMVRMLVQ